MGGGGKDFEQARIKERAIAGGFETAPTDWRWRGAPLARNDRKGQMDVRGVAAAPLARNDKYWMDGGARLAEMLPKDRAGFFAVGGFLVAGAAQHGCRAGTWFTG